MRCFLLVLVVFCLAVPGCAGAETADDYVARGDALFVNSENDKAILNYNQALAIDPKCGRAYRGRGLAWKEKHEYDKAIADYTAAIAINANDEFAYLDRGSAWNDSGGYGKAIADYTKAVAIDPNDSAAYEILASTYATCPDAKYRDGKKAIEIARKANELSGGKKSDCLDVLAAAYAESGDFKNARKTQEQAIESAHEALKDLYRSRLDLYKQGKPYHEPPVKK